MNKFGQEFMGKFDLGGLDFNEFFEADLFTIDQVVTKPGWYRYVNHYGVADIDYVGETINPVLMKQLREDERLFLSDGNDDFQYDVKEDFIDIENICYVRVDGK